MPSRAKCIHICAYGVLYHNFKIILKQVVSKIYKQSINTGCRSMFGLFGLFVLGCFLNTGLSNVISHKENGKASEAYEDIIQNIDYDEYSDDEFSPPGQMRTTTYSNTSTTIPFFDVEEKKVYQKTGQSIKLFCPVKNFDDARQQILWYKGDYPITNGLQSLNDIYKVDSSFNLVMEETTNDTLGSYFCSVMPQNVKLHITLQTDDPNFEIVSNSIEVTETNLGSVTMKKVMSINLIVMIVLLPLTVSIIVPVFLD